MSSIIRKTVRILLLNDENQLLLMRIEGNDVRTQEGNLIEKFWCTIGGGIEGQETIEQAALREIYEESGLRPEDISLMKHEVWHSSIKLYLKGELTHFHETYSIAKTKRTNVALYSPTKNEKRIVKELKWFSLKDIKESLDPIFPQFLSHYLPDILAERYPLKTITIDWNS